MMVVDDGAESGDEPLPQPEDGSVGPERERWGLVGAKQME